ncbi:carbon storage regulator CsrA [Stieleria sp.]|uniref:carbon storage regulator CsrA n=1 Tax=Stieleria sp. TaxID=2795976 RepID=UPI0035633CFB
MLVLSRKVGETIQIGSDIIIKVSSLSGGRVRIGIEAPRNVSIQRGELRPFIEPVAAPLQPTPACGDLNAQAS